MKACIGPGARCARAGVFILMSMAHQRLPHDRIPIIPKLNHRVLQLLRTKMKSTVLFTIATELVGANAHCEFALDIFLLSIQFLNITCMSIPR